MSTLRTLRRPDTAPIEISGRDECANGHAWEGETTRWRLRHRPDRWVAGKLRRARTGWERDCLLCKEHAKGRSGSGLRSQSWMPGATG